MDVLAWGIPINPTTGQNSNSTMHKRKRFQVSTACLRCRRSHSACSMTRPCDRCVRNGTEHECQDIPKRRPVVKKDKDGNEVIGSVELNSNMFGDSSISVESVSDFLFGDNISLLSSDPIVDSDSIDFLNTPLPPVNLHNMQYNDGGSPLQGFPSKELVVFPSYQSSQAETKIANLEEQNRRMESMMQSLFSEVQNLKNELRSNHTNQMVALTTPVTILSKLNPAVAVWALHSKRLLECNQGYKSLMLPTVVNENTLLSDLADCRKIAEMEPEIPYSIVARFSIIRSPNDKVPVVCQIVAMRLEQPVLITTMWPDTDYNGLRTCMAI